MWAQLSTWIVQDGKLPDIFIGSALPATGLAIGGSLAEVGFGLRHAILPGAVADPLLAQKPNLQSPYPYTVTGTASRAVDVQVGDRNAEAVQHIGANFVLDCNMLAFRAFATGTTAKDIAAGQQCTVSGEFSILADHESEYSTLDLTRVLRDWTVKRIQAQQYQIVWTETRSIDGNVVLDGEPAGLTDRTVLQQVDPWPDEERFASEPSAGELVSLDFYYLLDLEPRHK